MEEEIVQIIWGTFIVSIIIYYVTDIGLFAWISLGSLILLFLLASITSESSKGSRKTIFTPFIKKEYIKEKDLINQNLPNKWRYDNTNMEFPSTQKIHSKEYQFIEEKNEQENLGTIHIIKNPRETQDIIQSSSISKIDYVKIVIIEEYPGQYYNLNVSNSDVVDYYFLSSNYKEDEFLHHIFCQYQNSCPYQMKI